MTNLIIKEIAEKIRKVNSESTRPVDIWLCDQIANHIIDLGNDIKVENGAIVVKVEQYKFIMHFGHLLSNSQTYRNQLISFSDSEEEVYSFEPYVSEKEKRVEIL